MTLTLSYHSIPSVLVPLIIVGAVASRFFGGNKRGGYTGKYDPKTGLGRGAPGFRKCISYSSSVHLVSACI